MPTAARRDETALMVMIVITVVPFLDVISMLRVTKSNPGKASQLHKNPDTAIAGGAGLSPAETAEPRW
jgi:hypothetical protein